MITYESRLKGNTRWAFLEGSMHFEKDSAVHKTLYRIAAKLDELSIPYAVAGGMALFYHGYRRFTEDVDIIVTRESLKKIHDALEGLGYVPPFMGSKNLRDTDSGVKVEFILTGDFPGDGKPKPVAFPDPATIGERIDGVNFVDVPHLIELKLASGLTNPIRAKDIADVIEFIKEVRPPESLVNQLNPFVQAKFLELWNIVRDFRPQPE